MAGSRSPPPAVVCDVAVLSGRYVGMTVVISGVCSDARARITHYMDCFSLRQSLASFEADVFGRGNSSLPSFSSLIYKTGSNINIKTDNR